MRDGITALDLWVGTHGAFFWALAWPLWTLAAASILVLLPTKPVGRGFRAGRPGRVLLHPATFGALVLGALLCFRWPSLLGGMMNNPDETQLGAAAISYWRDPVPWRAVDLHTSGPANAWALWPLLAIRGRITYGMLHLAALVYEAAAALGVYAWLRRFASEGVARLGAWPLITFYALCTDSEITQYTSEAFSVALISVAAALLAAALVPAGAPPRGVVWRLILAGLLLGLVPWAKPQAIPVAAAVGVAGLAATLVGRPASRTRNALWLASAAAAPSAAMAVVLSIYGLWAQFHTAYILSNQVYTSDMEAARIRLWHDLATDYPSAIVLLPTLLWSLVGTALAAALAVGVFRLRPRIPTLAAWLIFALACWSVVFPGRAFPHYLQLLLVPASWLGGISLAALLRGTSFLPPARAGLGRGAILAGFLALAVVPLVRVRLDNPDGIYGAVVTHPGPPRIAVSERILQLSRPGDTLTVWGWMPALYVETNLPQGSREGHVIREIEASPLRQFYRDRFLRDLRRRPPAFIVDAVCAVAPMLHDRAAAGTRQFPEFDAYLRRHYAPPETFGGFLLYLRKDRVADAR